MSATVTLHVFSGRPDPAWELTDAQVAELSKKLQGLSSTTLTKPPGIIGALGYRGFTISAVGESKLEAETYIHAGVIDQGRYDVNLLADSPDIEEWLLNTGGDIIESDVSQLVQGELRRTELFSSERATPLVVPPYNPGKWNNDSNVLARNNCYNYANDKITNSFAQPGRGSGSMYSAIDCGNVGQAARRDGQESVGTPASTPSQGHFIALVVWPGADYHWYRLDNNTRWSHKPGRTPARNTDNSGRLITDPKTCDRGPYTAFCGYYLCIPSQTRIL